MSIEHLVKDAKKLAAVAVLGASMYLSGCGGGGGSTGGAVPYSAPAPTATVTPTPPVNNAPTCVYDNGNATTTVVAGNYTLKQASASDDGKVNAINIVAIPSSYAFTTSASGQSTMTATISGKIPLSAGNGTLKTSLQAVDDKGVTSDTASEVEDVLFDLSYVVASDLRNINQDALCGFLAKNFDVYNPTGVPGNQYVAVDAKTIKTGINWNNAALNHVQNSSVLRGFAGISIDYNSGTPTTAIFAVKTSLTQDAAAFATTYVERLVGGQYALNSMSAQSPVVEAKKTEFGL